MNPQQFVDTLRIGEPKLKGIYIEFEDGVTFTSLKPAFYDLQMDIDRGYREVRIGDPPRSAGYFPTLPAHCELMVKFRLTSDGRGNFAYFEKKFTRWQRFRFWLKKFYPVHVPKPVATKPAQTAEDVETDPFIKYKYD
jgi:hypothetical protein